MTGKDPNLAELRAAGARLLEGVDLEWIRHIGTEEARRIAMAIEVGAEVACEDALALALWAAKGGTMPA